MHIQKENDKAKRFLLNTIMESTVFVSSEFILPLELDPDEIKTFSRSFLLPRRTQNTYLCRRNS